MENTYPPLTQEQKDYLEGLRKGDFEDSKLIVNSTLSTQALKDFKTFRDFLSANGHSSLQPADLYLIVLKADFINLLNYANDRQCLILQCCFGFDIYPDNVPPNRIVGQVRLIQKGNFAETHDRKDEEFFHEDTVYRNGDGSLEVFMNMSYGQAILPGVGVTFTGNFRAIYPPERTPTDDPYILGYLLPVKALIKLLKDPSYPFVSTDILTFRWGLTAFDPANSSEELGNFTLIIGTHDLFIDPTIEFRTGTVRSHSEDVSNDCPPNRGC